MKWKLTALLTILAAAITIGATLLYSPKAECQYGSCPVNRKCYSDFDCNTLQCNLTCVQVDRLGTDKRCMVQ